MWATLTEIKVNNEGDARPRQEERGDKPPYFWWEFEDKRIDVRNVIVIHASGVNQSRLDKHRRNKGPENLSAPIHLIEEGLLKTYLLTGGALQNLSIVSLPLQNRAS